MTVRNRGKGKGALHFVEALGGAFLWLSNLPIRQEQSVVFYLFPQQKHL